MCGDIVGDEIEYEKVGYAALTNSKKAIKVKIDEEKYYISTRKLIKVLRGDKDWTAVVVQVNLDTSGLDGILDEIEEGGESE